MARFSKRLLAALLGRQRRTGGVDPTVSAGESTFVSDDYDITANSSSTATFTVTVKNASGQPIAGKTVTLTDETIAVSAANSTIEVSNATPDSGESVTVTVTLKDASDRAIPWIAAADMAVTATGSNNTIGSFSGVTSQNGQNVASYSSTSSGAHTLGATAFGVAITDTVLVTVSGTPEDYSIRAPEVTDKYLDPTAGVDGTGSEASPWNVFTNAKVSTLVAGQILWIKNGTFNWASLTTLGVGTSTDRIKIAAYPTHAPVATLSSSTSGFNASYGFGATGGTAAAYWDIYGITFTLAGRAGIIFGAQQWDNPTLTCENVRVINCIGNTTLAASDNGGIFMCDSGAEYMEFVTNTLTATGASGGSGTNRALIWCDYQTHLTLLGNLLNATGTSLPFYFKHTNAQTVDEVDRQMRNNIFYGGSRGTLFCGRFFQLTNNVFDGALVDFGDQGGGDVLRGSNTIVHNTFRNATVGFTTNGVGGENYDNILRDNVIMGTGELWDNPYAATDIGTLSSYNAYDAGSSEIRRNSSTYSRSAYQAAFTDREISSVSGTITLVGGGSPGVTPANWALAGGSAGENAASDGTDCGVDATLLLTTDVV